MYCTHRNRLERMCKFYKVLHALVCQAHTFGPVISFTLWIPGVYYFFQGVLKSWGIIVNKPMHSIMIIRFRSSLVQYTYTKYITVFNPTTLSISLLYLLYLLNTNKSTFQILTPFCFFRYSSDYVLFLPNLSSVMVF